MSVKRFISLFDSQSDKLLQEIDISYILLDDLIKICGFHDEDPYLYKIYFLGEKELNDFNKILKEPIKMDFIKKTYTLDCFLE